MKKSAVIKSEALRNIVAQISSGELVFPANVRATLKIQEALDEPKYGTDEIAKLIIQEPLVAARVIAVANSVASAVLAEALPMSAWRFPFWDSAPYVPLSPP